jgi:predicted dehydrogenase
MGQTHLDVYSQMDNVELVAIADQDEARLFGAVQAQGNIQGQGQGQADLTRVQRFTDGYELIESAAVDLVDVCVGTHLHLAMAKAVLLKGYHLMVEKPVAKSHAQGLEMLALARASQSFVMLGMCLRYWPAWVCLRQAIDDKRYGSLKSLSCSRLASFPEGEFYNSCEQCGGAILDLHIHDVDFISHCLGRPSEVVSRGHIGRSGGLDHVHTQYTFAGEFKDAVVTAQGGWSMAQGYPFNMSYTANFEQATLGYELGDGEHLILYHGGVAQAVDLAAGMGYEHEIKHLVRAILSSQSTDFDSLHSAVDALAVVEAEALSIATGQLQQPLYG